MNGTALPYFTAGPIVKGFGRGSSKLGIPTANFPEDVVEDLPPEIAPGVYYGWASLDRKDVYKMVMNIGWNPFYNNEKKSMEVHILHEFPGDLYGRELRIIILEYVRPEKNFSSVDDLIKEIRNDIAISNEKLDEPDKSKYKLHAFLKGLPR